MTLPVSDKGTAYLDFYKVLFAPFLPCSVKLLELGVAGGGSLLTWRDWFPHGAIVGIDRNLGEVKVPPNAMERIRCYQGHQEDLGFLQGVAAREGPFDIIIDDCSHRGDLTRASFWLLFDYLRPGGFYCIEDWGAGYFDHREYDGCRYEGSGHAAGMVGFIKELVDEVGARSITDERFGIPPERGSKFAYVIVHPGIAVARKP